METLATSGWETFSVYVFESTRVPSADGLVLTAVPLTVNVEEPTAVGVPEISPPGESVIPAG